MEEKTSDYVQSSNEEDQRNEKNHQYEIVSEFFSPLRENWSMIQEILLWQKLEVAIVCFNIINGLFWVFLTPCLQNCVSFVILASLVWLIPPVRLWVLSNINTRKLSAKHRENLDEDCSDVVVEDSSQIVTEFGVNTRLTNSNEKKTISYEDFCCGTAFIWGLFLKYYIKLQIMKEEKPQKFYASVALLVILLAIVYQRFPVANILYLIIMFVFLWPAIVFYGIKDQFVGKCRKLFKPFFTQWQNSQTKRKRNVTLKGRTEESDLSEEDDDFQLNTTDKETIMGSVVERLKQESRHGHFDSLDSSVISTEGLEFPSLRRDSVESYNSDDFIDGLNFGSFNADVVGSCHSSMDSLVGKEHEESQNEHEELRRDEEIQTRESVPLSREDEMRKLTEIDQSFKPPSRNKSSDSLQSYEIVDTSEIENVTTTPSTDESPAKKDSSYLASGAGYVGKFFGYS